MKTIITALLFLLPAILLAQAVDSVSIQQVDSLLQLSNKLQKKREFDQALELLAVAEKLSLEKLGEQSAAYGKCCHHYGQVLSAKRDFAAAADKYQESLVVQEKVSGKEQPGYASTMTNLAILWAKMRRFEKVEPYLLEARAIRERVLGKEHADYAASLINLGILYSQMGQLEKAEPLYVEALAINEKVLGKTNPTYVSGLVNLGILNSMKGQDEEAVSFFREALALFEKVHGVDHPHYGPTLNNLGGLYVKMAQYEKAEPILLSALANFEKTKGKEQPGYAHSLSSLGILYRNMGQLEKAEYYMVKTLAVLEKVYGKEHHEYAMSLFNLGGLQMSMGQDEKVEHSVLEALAIIEKTTGKEQLTYAKGLINLGTIYRKMGQLEKAELLLLESLAIIEKVKGKKQLDYARNLNNLGALYSQKDQNEKAESMYLEAREIFENRLENREQEAYFQCLSNLGGLYKKLDQFEKAESLLLEAYAFQERVLGKDHPSYASGLNNLGNLYEHQQKYTESESMLEENFSVTRTSLIRSTSFLSERELASYISTFSQSGAKLSSMLLARTERAVQTEVLAALQYDQVLFQKGFLLTAASRLNSLSASSPEAEDLSIRLKGYRRRLATELAKPLAEQSGMETLEENANSTEKELARVVAGYAENSRQVSWQEVQSALQPGEAALEFIRFRVNFPKKTDSLQYATLLLRPGDEIPHFIPLFEEKSFDSLLILHQERRSDYVNDLYAFSDRGGQLLDKPKKTLYDLVWQPLEQALGDVKTVYYSPAGLLHRINLHAITLDEETTLSDRFELVRLNSTRQLVLPASNPVAENDAVLFGAIQYESDSAAITISNAELLDGAFASRGKLPWSSTDTNTRGGTWNFLKWTKEEVESISAFMESAGYYPTIRTDYQATEEAFRSIGQEGASPRVLHIATHGFFFPDPVSVSSTFDGAMVDGSQQAAGGKQEPVFKISDHPMIRSGLIMAGGNHAWQGKPSLEGMEDGILTAYEISQMDLSQTELVVLSACETGLGDIQGNEGVYGLQRAFRIAGAKYLIMSLWQVPDRETKDFMVTFYRHWLEDEMKIPDAFRQTQHEMKERFYNPFQWAGFVLLE